MISQGRTCNVFLTKMNARKTAVKVLSPAANIIFIEKRRSFLRAKKAKAFLISQGRTRNVFLTKMDVRRRTRIFMSSLPELPLWWAQNVPTLEFPAVLVYNISTNVLNGGNYGQSEMERRKHALPAAGGSCRVEEYGGEG